MQPLTELLTTKIKKQTRYDLVKEIADRLNDPVGKWLSFLKGWEWKDIDEVYRSAQALAKDQNMNFGKAFNWHYKEIIKTIK